MGDTTASPQDRAEAAIRATGEAASAIKSCSAFWESALGKLEPDEQREIIANGLKLTDLNTILKEAEKKQREWEEKTLTFSFRGKEYKANEIWGKIVQGISVFKNFIGNVVAQDVSGKAALPWAVIKLVLGALEYKQEQLETIGGAMKTVVEIIGYYVEFEALYKNGHWQAVQQLKSAIVDVYADILRVLCLARAYYTKKGVFRRITNLLYDPAIFKNRLQSIENGNLKVENWARLVRWETEQRASDRVQEIQSHLESLAFWADIKSLSSISSVNDHVDQSRQRLPGTGLWLMNHHKFQDWRYSGTSSLMLLSGSVGTGKTILTSLVIDGFLHNFRTVAKSPALYFYCKPGQDPEDVLRNLVRQLILAQSDAHEHVEETLRGNPKISASDCRSRIETFIKSQDSVAIIIDSLESCCSSASNPSKKQDHESPSSYTFLNLFKDLTGIMKTSRRPVKVFISCRSPSDGIEGAYRAVEWEHKYHVSANDQPTTDVEQVVKHEVEHWVAGQFLPNLDGPEGDTETRTKAEANRAKAKAYLVGTIARRAHGMFTWAILVLKWRFRDNTELRTIHDVKYALKEDQLPPTLEKLYDATYDVLYGSNSSPSSRRGGDAVKILFCARKQLSSTAFIDAVRAAKSSTTAEPYGKTMHDLVSDSLGWIIYDTERDVFRFQHPSVEQYLRMKKAKTEYEARAHSAMAEVCLRSICTAISRRNSFVEKLALEEEDIPERGRSLERGSHRPSPSPTGYEIVYGFSLSPGHDKEHENSPSPSSPRSRSLHYRRGSVSDRSSSRSESENRPQPRIRLEEPRGWDHVVVDNGEDDMFTSRRTSCSLWSVIQRPARGRRTDAEQDNPIQDFHEYATLYWLTHYQSCRDVCSEYRDLEEFVDDILLSSWPEEGPGSFDLWIEGVQKLLSRRPLGFYSETLEAELSHCISWPPTPLQVSCVYGLTRIVKELCSYPATDGDSSGSPKVDVPLMPNNKGLTGLHLACKFGHLETVRYLATLKTAKEDFVVRDREGKTPLEYAVEGAKDSEKAVEHSKPTELVEEVLNVNTVRELRTTSGVLVAAMNNPSCAKSLVRLLLGRQPGSYYKIHPSSKTPELAIAAISYPFTTLDLVKHVTDKSKIDADIIIAAAGSKKGREIKWHKRERIWKWLIEKEGEVVTNNPDIVRLAIVAALENQDPELLRYLFRRVLLPCELLLLDYRMILGSVLPSTTRPGELVDVVLKRCEDFQIPRFILEKTLENPTGDVMVISKLIRHVGKDAAFNMPMLKAIARNRRYGAEILEVMMTKLSGIALGFEEEPGAALQTAVANGNVAVLKVFLEKLKITVDFPSMLSKIVSEAPGERFLGALKKKYATIARPATLYESEGPEDRWDGLIAECVRLLADKVEGSNWITPEIVEKAASIRGPKVMEFLFDHPRVIGNPKVHVSKAMMLAAAKNTIYGYKLLQFLERRAAHWDLPPDDTALDEDASRDVLVDDEVLQAAARYGDIRIVTFLLGSEPLENYSKEFRIAAAANPDPAIVEYVFRRVGPGSIRMDELETAAATSDAVFECVLRHYVSVSRTMPRTSKSLSEIIANKCRRSKTLREAFERGVAQEPTSRRRSEVLHKALRKAFEWDVSQEPTSPLEAEVLLKAAVKNEHGLEMANFILNRYQMTDKRIRVSTTLLEAAADNGAVAPEMLRLLLGQCDDSWVESLITIDVLVKAATNGYEAPEALRMLLMELTPAKLSVEDKTTLRAAIEKNPKQDAITETFRVYQQFLSESDE